MSPQEKYQLLADKQIEIGWPKIYVVDLHKYDREALQRLDPTFFLWVVRETGTWLLLPDHPWSMTTLGYVLDHVGDPINRAFVFDNNRLVEREVDQGLWDLLLKRSKSKTIRRFASLRSKDGRFWNSLVVGSYADQIERELDVPGLAEVI